MCFFVHLKSSFPYFSSLQSKGDCFFKLHYKAHLEGQYHQNGGFALCWRPQHSKFVQGGPPVASKLFFPSFCVFFWQARVCWTLLCLCRPFCIFGRCLDSNPETCRSKQVRYYTVASRCKLYRVIAHAWD